MTTIHIRKTGPDQHEQYVVPAVAINTPQGKKLIPNPSGNELCMFDTLQDAELAVRRAGFDYVYEGQKTYTIGQAESATTSRQVTAGMLYSDPLRASVNLLIQRLKDKENAVIANAAFALGELKAVEAIPALCDILGHDDAGIRKNVADALARMGQAGLTPLKKAWQASGKSGDHYQKKDAPYIRLTIMSAYASLCQMSHARIDLAGEMMPQVIEALEDESWLVRAQAALVAGYLAQQYHYDS